MRKARGEAEKIKKRAEDLGYLTDPTRFLTKEQVAQSEFPGLIKESCRIQIVP